MAEIPYPFDHYAPWQPPLGMDAFQESLVLSAYSPGSRIVEASSYRPGYMQYPLRVRVQTAGGKERGCVLKADPLIGGVEREAALLPVLSRLGLAVPAVLAGPIAHPDYPNAGALLVLSEMRGEPLPWLDATLMEVDATCRLLQEGVGAMHRLTEQIRREDVAMVLPERTMPSELEGICQRGGPWLDVPLFSEAIRRLRPILERIHTPLVFSNGDYNPLNFLWDGERLSGWIDFTGACFEDPHIGFAKFVIWAFDSYGWGPGARAGLVERYLYAQDVSRSEFAPRLALRCLWRLQRDTSVTGREDAFQREAIVNVLQHALAGLG
ncbi:MAG: aminoglycoside phosphotransferase family protein [Anaerolineae bacterium]